MAEVSQQAASGSSLPQKEISSTRQVQGQAGSRSSDQSTANSGYSGSADHIHYDVSTVAGSDQAVMMSQHGQLPANYYHDNGMYSQSSGVPAYIESSGHHQQAPQQQQQGQPPSQTSSVPMYQSYPSHNNSTNSSSTSTMSPSVGVNPQAIGVAQQAYLPGHTPNQRVPISHTTRASPATVQWLLENFETTEGVSLPRSTLYCHYLRHSSEHKIDPVNAASFGKLIRSVFLGLKTRRLGTRGNSKYHYYGVRVKPTSPLAQLTEEIKVAMRQQPTQPRRFKGSRLDEENMPANFSPLDGYSQHQQLQQHQQYLGDTTTSFTEWAELELEDEDFPDGVTEADLESFAQAYREHCEALFDAIVSLQFSVVESNWLTFWKATPPDSKQNDSASGNFVDTKGLSKPVLVAISGYKPVHDFIKSCDYQLYQKCVDVLIPDVLRAVPSALTQGIRNFAKGLEGWLVSSLAEMSKELLTAKLSAACAFSQTLRRYTSLNHLAQAARAVLQNSQQISQMLTDLNRVDFNNVQEQASWVCQCDEADVHKLEEDFKLTLAQQQTLEQWSKWLDKVVTGILEPHAGKETFPKVARQFLLKWSFYSSMVIRDLTLRSAASFGSFHLIRLLYDEYMFYLVEHKVAAATGKSPLAVMAEFVGLGNMFSSMSSSYSDDASETGRNLADFPRQSGLPGSPGSNATSPGSGDAHADGSNDRPLTEQLSRKRSPPQANNNGPPVKQEYRPS